MLIQKTFKFRLCPTKRQEKFLENQFGACRFVFNFFLRKRMDFYASHKEEKKRGLNFFDTAKMLTQLKASAETTWLREVNSQSLQSSLKNLDIAYHNFFNRRTLFPKFKSKRDKQSFVIPQHFSFENCSIKIPKIGNIKAIFHRKIEGHPKHITISKTKTGKYFASVLCEIEKKVKIKSAGKQIGIDLGLKSFLTISDGRVVKHPKYLQLAEVKLKKLQKIVSRRKKGGANKHKAIRALAIQHEKVANKRNDFLHKLSSRLICDSQEICAEDLNIKGMQTNHHLAKSISDSGWGEFIRQLQYKSKWNGVRFNQIERFFPSSKRCFFCGWINQGLTLKDRRWECQECHSEIDRDLNATRNILLFGHDSLKPVSRVGHTRISTPVERTRSKTTR